MKIFNIATPDLMQNSSESETLVPNKTRLKLSTPSFARSLLVIFVTLSADASRCLPTYMHDSCSVDDYSIIEIEKRPPVVKSIYHSPKTHKRSRGKKYYVKKCRKVVRYR